MLENLLEQLCAACGRNLAIERIRCASEELEASALAAQLVDLGVLTREEAKEQVAHAGPRDFFEHLLDRGLLRRDLRLTLELNGAEGWHAYGARPLKEIALSAEVERALEARRQQGGALTELLREEALGRLGASIRGVGADAGLECLRRGETPDPSCWEALPRRALEVFRSVPLRREGDALVVALWNPLDFQAIADLESLQGSPIHAVLGEPEAIDQALGSLGISSSGSEVGVALERGESAELDEAELSLDPLLSILLEALEEGASEVLVEPGERSASLRFRVRGELRKKRRLPTDVPELLVEELSSASGESIRGGTVRCEVSGLPVLLDYRIVETPLGPSLALELEDALVPTSVELGHLGLGLEGLAALEANLAERRGMFVVAAPNRGERSSAYYGLLARAVRLGGGVISVEHRIGRPLEGVTQIELRQAKNGLDLDRLLRPRPDWLCYDGPPARKILQLAVDAGLQGSGVILTVGAPDARSALLRLEMAGIPRRLLEEQVRCVVARRVVPVICPHCRVEQGSRWVGLGCAACADLGTSGSLPLAELVRPHPEDGVRPIASTPLLAIRARELALAGEVSWGSVSDVLGNEITRRAPLEGP